LPTPPPEVVKITHHLQKAPCLSLLYANQGNSCKYLCRNLRVRLPSIYTGKAKLSGGSQVNFKQAIISDSCRERFFIKEAISCTSLWFSTAEMLGTGVVFKV